MLFTSAAHDDQGRGDQEGERGSRAATPRTAAAPRRPRARRPLAETARSAAATPRRSSTGPGASAIPIRRTSPECHPKVAMADAIIALTTNIAIKDQQADRVQARVVRHRQRRNARRREAGSDEVQRSAACDHVAASQAATRDSQRRRVRHSRGATAWKNGRSACSPASTRAWA